MKNSELHELFKIMPITCIRFNSDYVESITCNIKFNDSTITAEPADANYFLTNDNFEDYGLYFVDTPINLMSNIHLNEEVIRDLIAYGFTQKDIRDEDLLFLKYIRKKRNQMGTKLISPTMYNQKRHLDPNNLNTQHNIELLISFKNWSLRNLTDLHIFLNDSRLINDLNNDIYLRYHLIIEYYNESSIESLLKIININNNPYFESAFLSKYFRGPSPSIDYYEYKTLIPYLKNYTCNLVASLNFEPESEYSNYIQKLNNFYKTKKKLTHLSLNDYNHIHDFKFINYVLKLDHPLICDCIKNVIDNICRYYSEKNLILQNIINILSDTPNKNCFAYELFCKYTNDINKNLSTHIDMIKQIRKLWKVYYFLDDHLKDKFICDLDSIEKNGKNINIKNLIAKRPDSLPETLITYINNKILIS
ncbi:MAG: hypothetical protein Hyperionvirus18_18 [Hyperionvirus sp.]|uniref:Uncharacterized protein n=1 Tax=Hyperionvirus sp. TaxID=2487770 RepID=A0A3G5AAK8_9VIRU|nr:MAG: hypothetical protein Hyperionvirus18_18 [Hyperionvirus sp.]